MIAWLIDWIEFYAVSAIRPCIRRDKLLGQYDDFATRELKYSPCQKGEVNIVLRGLWRHNYIVAPTHITVGDILCLYPRHISIYCRRYEIFTLHTQGLSPFWVRGIWYHIWYIHVLAYIVVGDNTCQNVLHILSPHIVKHFKKIRSIDRERERYRSIDWSRERERERQKREKERERWGVYKFLLNLKKNKFHVWVYPTVDGPSRYDYKKIDGVYNKKCFCFFIMTVSQRLWCWFDMTSSVPCIIT